MLKSSLLALLTTLNFALAQEIQPVSTPAQPAPPLQVEPLPAQPLPTQSLPTLPTNSPANFAKLDGVSAALSAPRSSTGGVNLSLTLKSNLPRAVNLAAGRDNEQACATAPIVRVLRVGTREVVYPAPGASPRICTQDMVETVLNAGGNVTFNRALPLPAGDYMIEGWWQGFADGLRVKVPALPVRVTVN